MTASPNVYSSFKSVVYLTVYIAFWGLTISHNCNGQNNTKLFGFVKSVYVESIMYDSSGQLKVSEYSTFNKDGLVTNKELTTYIYGSNHKILDKRTTSTVYEYDLHGKLIVRHEYPEDETTKYMYEDSILSYTWTYNNDSVILSESIFENTDFQKTVLRYINHNDQRTLLSKTINVYSGLINSASIVYAYGDTSTRLYLRNEQKNIIRELILGTNNIIRKRIDYEYDKTCNVIKAVSYVNDVIAETIKYVYSGFDEKNNYLSMKKYVDGSLKLSSKRKIEYY